MPKSALAKKLKVSVAKINEYILGDDEPPYGVKIIPAKNGIVNVEFSEDREVPKYEGVFFNELKNGDKTYYIVYKDIVRRKTINLKIGRKSEGITEVYCQNKRQEILKQIRLGENPTKIKNKRILKEIITFDMLAHKYHQDRLLYLKKENVNESISMYKNHIKPFIGENDIEAIQLCDIERIMQSKKEKLANATINSIVEKISTIFNFGLKKSIFKDKNPVIGIEKLPESSERTRFLSKEEISLLIEEVKNDEILYLFTMLSLTTGGRLKTICNIKIKDIKFEDMFIDLQDFKNKTFYKGFIKQDKYFLNILTQNMQDKNSTDFLLGRNTLIANVRYIERNMPKIFQKLFNQNILESDNLSPEELAENRREKVVIHTLRHTFASQLVINGTPIFTVKNLMNHKDIQQTMRYAKLAPDSGRDFVNDIF